MTNVKNIPLYEEHLRLKALLAPFAGWNMPIHYGSILEEAKYTRAAVSIFDISHMGEFIIREDPAASSLDRAVTISVAKMKNGRCRYGFLLNEEGKILDDLIAYQLDAGAWMLVVNACNEQRDFTTLAQRLSPGACLEHISSRTVRFTVHFHTCCQDNFVLQLSTRPPSPDPGSADVPGRVTFGCSIGIGFQWPFHRLMRCGCRRRLRARKDAIDRRGDFRKRF
jgi:hypothetical protein